MLLSPSHPQQVLDGGPGSWLQSGPALRLGVKAIWRINHWMEMSVSNFTFQIDL